MNTRRKLQDNKLVNRFCPACDEQGMSVKLVVKTNRFNDSQFLGCPNYPRCRFTAEIPEALRMELEGQPTLFGVTS